MKKSTLLKLVGLSGVAFLLSGCLAGVDYEYSYTRHSHADWPVVTNGPHVYQHRSGERYRRRRPVVRNHSGIRQHRGGDNGSGIRQHRGGSDSNLTVSTRGFPVVN